MLMLMLCDLVPFFCVCGVIILIAHDKIVHIRRLRHGVQMIFSDFMGDNKRDVDEHFDDHASGLLVCLLLCLCVSFSPWSLDSFGPVFLQNFFVLCFVSS